MDCVNCATPIPQDAKFCQNCGSQVSDAEGQARVSASMDQRSFAHMEKILREESQGEFEIEGLLGRGGMAVVFLAREIHLDRKVAIKVLPPELTFGHGVERFKREAKTAAALDHPHIIPIYRIASEGTLFWYAMKYLEGQALDEVLREKPRMKLEETIEILVQVADALDYAHEHQVIHRDIKPANIMLDHRNRVVVTDFGIAKAMTEQTLTASGSVVGTPYYMSPEQGMGKGVTGAADQYSVAVMAYRMLSGQVPFEGDSAIDILHKHCMIAPPPLEVIQSGLPKHVYKAVHKALEKKAEDRFASCSDFVKALKAPTPETEAYPDIHVTPPLDPASSEVATVVMQSGMAPGSGPGGVSADAPTQITPLSGESRAVSPHAAAKTQAMVGTPSREGRGKGVLVGLGLGAVVIVGAIGVVVMKGGGGGDQSAPVQQPGQTTRMAQPPTDPVTPAQPATGTVEVIGLPSGGVVFVDGEEQAGTTFDLEQGGYTLVLRADGYERDEQRVTVIAGRTAAVGFSARRAQVAQAQPTRRPAQPIETPPQAQPREAPVQAQQPAEPLQGFLLLRTSPRADEIFIDQVSKGRPTGVYREALAPGRHLVSIRKAGYVPLDTAIVVTAGDTVRLTPRLQRQN